MKSRAVLNYKNVNECCSHFSDKKAFNLQFKKKVKAMKKFLEIIFLLGLTSSAFSQSE
jgi:hypothetical protein